MKKSLLTLSMVAFFALVSNAQDDKKTPAEKNPAKKEVVNVDGTTSTVDQNPAKESPAKKSGTRMAINEKGTSGNKTTSNKKDAAK